MDRLRPEKSVEGAFFGEGGEIGEVLGGREEDHRDEAPRCSPDRATHPQAAPSLHRLGRVIRGTGNPPAGFSEAGLGIFPVACLSNSMKAGKPESIAERPNPALFGWTQVIA
jgi:hypothetical protein